MDSSKQHGTSQKTSGLQRSFTLLWFLYIFSLFLEPVPPGKDQNPPGAEEELSGVTGTQPPFSHFTCFSAFGPKQLLGCRPAMPTILPAGEQTAGSFQGLLGKLVVRDP